MSYSSVSGNNNQRNSRSFGKNGSGNYSHSRSYSRSKAPNASNNNVSAVSGTNLGANTKIKTQQQSQPQLQQQASSSPSPSASTFQKSSQYSQQGQQQQHQHQQQQHQQQQQPSGGRGGWAAAARGLTKKTSAEATAKLPAAEKTVATTKNNTKFVSNTASEKKGDEAVSSISAKEKQNSIANGFVSNDSNNNNKNNDAAATSTTEPVSPVSKDASNQPPVGKAAKSSEPSSATDATIPASKAETLAAKLSGASATPPYTSKNGAGAATGKASSAGNYNGHINNFNAAEVQSYLSSKFQAYLNKAKENGKKGPAARGTNDIKIYKPQESGWGKISSSSKKGGSKSESHSTVEILNEIAKGL